MTPRRPDGPRGHAPQRGPQGQPQHRLRPRRGATPARRIALDALLLSDKRGVPLDAALDRLCEARPIDPRDRRLAEEVVYGTARHRASIDAVLAAVSSRPLHQVDAAVLAALRCAVYQTFFLTRLPPHAVVDETARLVRQTAGEKPVGFANAVLRRALELRAGRGRGGVPPADRRRSIYFRDGEHLLLRESILPDPAEDQYAWLAAHYSYPRWLVERLCASLGRERAVGILRWGNRVPHTAVRVNPLRAEAAALAGVPPQQLLGPGGIFLGCAAVEPAGRPGCWLLSVDGNPGDLPGLRSGLFTFQDPSQQAAAELLAPKPGEKVLDLCAAPGGKATHLAELSQDRAAVLACDADAERLSLVTEAAARLGLGSIETRRLEVPPLPPEMKGAFDAVLADVPCSNTGAMNRRAEARWKASAEAVAALAARQKDILLCALDAAVPGGRVVYSTCSLLEEENGSLVRALIAERPGTRLVQERLTLPEPGCRDGGYVALLEP